jgi:DNA-directed RNA polymerase specialized sigma subunit
MDSPDCTRPPLSRDERDRLIGRYEPLARSIARQEPCPRIGRCQDRLAAAYLGLTKAANHYDQQSHPETPFGPFAKRSIHWECARECYQCRRHWCRQLPPDDELVDRRRSDRWQVDHELVSAIRATLPAVEASVVEARHPLDGSEPVLLRVLAAETGLSISYLSRLDQRGLSALRQSLKSEVA